MKRTSEFVTIGHPDRMADYISSYILDRYLEEDPAVRFALEVQVKDDFVSLAGEITSKAVFVDDDIESFVAEAVREIGYTDEYADIWNADGKHVIDPRRLEVAIHVSRQSPDIACGVNRDGWGDQGIFFGLACRETPELMPKDHTAAKNLGEFLFEYARKNMERFGIDIKTQVTVDDFGNITDVVVAIPCRCKDAVEEIRSLVQSTMIVDDPFVIVNGTGSYVTHSSVGDCGTTGRKLVVDFYGSGCRIGGGSPWTKDPSKADLSLNLFARHVAIAELEKRPNARSVFVALSCCIGRKDIECVVTAGGATESWTFDCYGPKRIAEKFNLRSPRYASACSFGLFREFEELGK